MNSEVSEDLLAEGHTQDHEKEKLPMQDRTGHVER